MKREYIGTDAFLAATEAGEKDFSFSRIKGVHRLPEGTIFEEFDFTQTDFIDCSFDGCKFSYCNFTYSLLASVRLTGCKISVCSMSQLRVKGGSWKHCDFHDVALWDAEFRHFMSTDCRYAYCDLHGVYAIKSEWHACRVEAPKDIGATMALPGLVHDVILSTEWNIAFIDDYMQIGCQLHKIEDWFSFHDATIAAMDSKALDWWRTWKPILQTLTKTALLK